MASGKGRFRSDRYLGPYWVWLLLLLGLAMTLNAEPETNPLVSERWEHRPLVLLTPSTQEQAYRAYMSQLDARQSAFEDRDMVRYVLTPDAAMRAGNALSTEARDALAAAIDAESIEEPGFVLVGKDGTVKMRGSLETSLDAIFERIDGMPMRQREMRESR